MTDTPRATVRLPTKLRQAVESYAQRTGATFSDALRELLKSALAQQGTWPPGERA